MTSLPTNVTLSQTPTKESSRRKFHSKPRVSADAAFWYASVQVYLTIAFASCVSRGITCCPGQISTTCSDSRVLSYRTSYCSQ